MVCPGLPSRHSGPKCARDDDWEVVLEGGLFELPSPGLLDVLLELYEALQWHV